jgi:hypothetical protein
MRLLPLLTLSRSHRHTTFGSSSCHRPWTGRLSRSRKLQGPSATLAGAWGWSLAPHAPPCEALGLHLVSPLFKVLVRMRLRLALPWLTRTWPAHSVTALPTGSVIMLACVHAAVTAPKGIIVFGRVGSTCQSSGFEPGSRKGRAQKNLVHGPEDGSSRGHGGRRPADVWVPSWGCMARRL